MLRWMIIDPTIDMNHAKPEDVISDQIKALYNHDDNVHRQHSENIQIHDQSYKTAFNKIMLQNTCPEIIPLNEPSNITRCE